MLVERRDGKIDAGDTVAIYGRVEQLPSTEERRAALGFDALRPAELAGLQVMIVGQRVVETLDRPSGN